MAPGDAAAPDRSIKYRVTTTLHNATPTPPRIIALSQPSASGLLLN
jgi:hypothetical protein